MVNLHHMTLSLPDLLLSAALAVYMTASVFVAAVRWGHRCQPYGKHMDYYYPAWKVVIFCFLSNLIMAPAIFMPTDADAVMQLRLLLILASPFFCAVLMFSYFGRVLGKDNWRRPVYALSVPFVLMAVTATVLALTPGKQMDRDFCRWFFSAGGTLALVFLVFFVTSIIMVARELRRFSEDNFSNPNDFPHQYASGVIWIPVLHMIVSWITASVGTPVALSVGLLVLSALALALLIGILSPHRALNVEQLEALSASSAQDVAHSEEPLLSKERQEEILKAIRRYVEKEQAYLDSHLSLDGLSRHIGINSKYVSLVMKSRLGGFFSYVNNCRLSHAERLLSERPDIPVGELIDLSGFGSRTTYYKVRKQLEG